MNKKPLSLLLVPIFLPFFFLSGCRAPQNARVSGDDIRDCFVAPSALKYAALGAGKHADTAALRAAFRFARGAADTGTARARLIDSAGVPYSLGYSTPRGMRHDTAYPLVIYLHGGVGTERNDKGDSAFLMLAALADTFGLFLASPSANRHAPWWGPLGLSRILQSLRFMTMHFPVNTGKVFLAGVSDGATGCYAAANTIPAPFAGFIAVSGFGGMLPALGMRLVPDNMKPRPIYNVNAGRDHLYPAENVAEFVRALKEQGVAVTLKIHPDETHGFDYRAKEMGALAEIIRSWSRPETPGLSWTFISGFPNLPDNLADWALSSENATVSGFWRRDTLVVGAEGVRSLTASFPAAAPREKIFCRISSGGKAARTRTFAPSELRWPEPLRFMVKQCAPEIGGIGAMYTIRF